jgi:hypothetical protein
VGSVYGEVIDAHPTRKTVDYNKSGKAWDDKLCWAYALSNVFRFSYNASHEDAQDLFSVMYKKFGSDGQKMRDVVHYVWYEYVNNDNSKLSIQEQSELLYWWYDHTNISSNVMWIKGALLQGRVVLIGIDDEEGNGHVVTCYGYKYENGRRYFAIADSDDKADGAFWTELYPSETKWHLKGYEGYYIDAAYSFKVMD